MPAEEKPVRKTEDVIVNEPKSIEEETEILKVELIAPVMYSGDDTIKAVKQEDLETVLGLRDDYLGYGRALSKVWQQSLFHGYLPKYPKKRVFGEHLNYKDISLKPVVDGVLERWKERCPSVFKSEHFTNTFIEYTKGDNYTAGSYGYRMFHMYRDLPSGKLELRGDTVEYLKWLEGNRLSIIYHPEDPLKTYKEYNGVQPWEHEPKYKYYSMGLPGDFLDETLSHELTHDFFKQIRRIHGYQQIGTAYFEESIALVMSGLCYHSSIEDMAQVKNIIEEENQNPSKWPYDDFNWSEIFDDYSQKDGEAHYHFHIALEVLIIAQKISGDWNGEDQFLQTLISAMRNMRGRIVSCQNLTSFCAGLFSWQENLEKYGTPKPMVYTLAELLHQLEKETVIPKIAKPFWKQIKKTMDDIELQETL